MNFEDGMIRRNPNTEKQTKRQSWKDRDARLAARKLDWARREAIEEKKFQWRLRRDGLA